MDGSDVLRTNASGWTILRRMLVGLAVFFPEGIQKLIFPPILGAGRFANIGIPYPDLMGYVAAGCAASRLTARELTKCVEHGIGGDDGCFGNNNNLVGRNGFVVRNIAALGGGPNSVIRDPAKY
jgi:hypothetical protein